MLIKLEVVCTTTSAIGAVPLFYKTLKLFKSSIEFSSFGNPFQIFGSIDLGVLDPYVKRST